MIEVVGQVRRRTGCQCHRLLVTGDSSLEVGQVTHPIVAFLQCEAEVAELPGALNGILRCRQASSKAVRARSRSSACPDRQYRSSSSTPGLSDAAGFRTFSRFSCPISLPVRTS